MDLESLVEVTLQQSDDFLKVAETLSRIGVSSKPQTADGSEKPTLYQSCHILHKRGKYYIVHFKEMFKLDGKPSSLNESDIARRNTIANLLEEWGLVTIVNKKVSEEPKAPMSQIKVVSHRDKGNYNLMTKYSIGRKK